MEEKIHEIKERLKETSTGYWQLVTDPNKVGANWNICYFGNSGEDGKDYCLYITTIDVPCSQMHGDAKRDAIFVAHAKEDIVYLLNCIEDLKKANEMQMKLELDNKNR